MRYERPELGERLAADYALGLMPPRARRRFEWAMARHATLSAAVAAWTERLAPLDEMTDEAAAPAHVWRAIERRAVVAAPAPVAARPRSGVLIFWRSLAATALAACAALVVYIALYPTPLPKVVAVLADKAGLPGWVAFAGSRSGEIGVSALGTVGAETGHSLELWGIAGGTPQPLGLLPVDPDQPLWVRAATLPGTDGALAVSIEPPGGSPTGLPTGPVVYQGKVLRPPH
jgi:anti-sigma-K factor RskA